jgi:hypothetical protein
MSPAYGERGPVSSNGIGLIWARMKPAVPMPRYSPGPTRRISSTMWTRRRASETRDRRAGARAATTRATVGQPGIELRSREVAGRRVGLNLAAVRVGGSRRSQAAAKRGRTVRARSLQSRPSMPVQARQPERRDSLGVDLERCRLVHRRSRLERVVRILRNRASKYAASRGAAPKPLIDAISGFVIELHDVRTRLRDLEAHSTRFAPSA